MKRVKRILSLLLAALLLLSLLPAAAFAEEAEQDKLQTEQQEELTPKPEETETPDFPEEPASTGKPDPQKEPDSPEETGEKHEHDYTGVLTEPTCVDRGYTTYTCTCGDVYIDDYTDALGHTPEDAAEIPAEVGKPGRTAGKICAVCGAVLEGCEEIPALEEPEDERVRVVFDCTPEEAQITVYACTEDEEDVSARPDEEGAPKSNWVAVLDEAGEPVVIEPEGDGSYLLLPGVYLYDMEAEGYVSLEKAELTVSPLNEDETEQRVAVELEASQARFEVFRVVGVNPIYADVVDESELSVPELSEEDLAAAFSAIDPPHVPGVFYSSLSAPNTTIMQAAAEVREGFVNRAAQVEVYIRTNGEQDWGAVLAEILDASFLHTGAPKEGDYLRFTFQGYGAAGGIYADANLFYYVIEPSFYTSASQEAQMDNQVDAVLASLSLDGKTTYEQIQSIYDYLCRNVTYDYANLSNENYHLKYTGYAALVNRTAVCQGYANAFYRLCLEANIDARIISSDEMCHAWNIVKLGGSYYEMDATWDASESNPPKHNFFLRGSTYWLAEHKNESGVSTLGDQFDNGSFSGYALSSSDYSLASQPEAVPINATNFPDATVRNLISDNFDTDKDGFLSYAEITDVTELDINDLGITSLKGIEYFTELTHLDCAGNQLSSLDLSHNTKLVSLLVGYQHDGSGYEITHSGEVHGNQLTSLDLSHNPALEYLVCAENKLTSLNLSGCSKLRALYCYGNQLTSLNLSGCKALELLSCPNNKITALNASGLTALTHLICWNNSLTSLNVSGCAALVLLSCGGNQLSSLNVSGCPALEALYVSYEVQENDGTYTIHGNNLKTLDLSHNPALVEVQCFGNQLTSLNASGCSALMGLYCSGNQLTNLNLTGCTALVDLYCFNNKLTSLDLSGRSALTTLYCYDNSLRELKLSGCSSLKILSCYANSQLGRLNISSSPNLLDLVRTAERTVYSDAIVYEGSETLLAHDPKTVLETTGTGLSIYALTNNQSILVKFQTVLSGCEKPSNYVVTNSAGTVFPLSYAGNAKAETGDASTFKLNFPDPLLADTYHISTLNGSGECDFEISLHLSTYRIVNSRNVIIQLNEPIIGCTTAENYEFHTLSGEVIPITSAVSAFQEIGGEAPNVFRLTTASTLQPGTTYVVETRGMSWNGKACQGTIGYFTMEDLPESSGVVPFALTNNQSIIVRFDNAVSGRNNKSNYVITNSSGQAVALSYAGDAQGETGVANTVKLNFPDPLPADVYHIKTQNMSEVCECDFEISLNLTVYRFVDKRSVIIQLNEPIIGCTTAENYEFHTLSGEVIPVTSAVSAFQEIGGEAPNVFRLTTAKDLQPGTTYVVETRGMSWNGKACQGTIAYITP